MAFSEKDYKAVLVKSNSTLTIAIEKYVEIFSVYKTIANYIPLCVGYLQSSGPMVSWIRVYFTT